MTIKRFHTDSFEEALEEKFRLKRESGGYQVVRIVKSPYQGYDILAVDKDLYVELISAHLFDGLPSLIPMRDCSKSELDS